MRLRCNSAASQWQVRELHPTSQAYETRLDSGPPASFVVLIERRVTKGRVELPSSREHDVLSIACLPVAPLGRESSCDKRRGPVIRFAQSCGTRHSALRSRLSTLHDPCGNRTRLASVRGWRPEPIDERAGHDLQTASGRSRTCIARRRVGYSHLGTPIPSRRFLVRDREYFASGIRSRDGGDPPECELDGTSGSRTHRVTKV